MTSKLDTFTQAYIEAALWASTDDQDVPLDRNYTLADLDPEALAKMMADCERFQRENESDLTSENLVYRSSCSIDERAGHDFWLTRNRHGAGFWDGDWTEPAASRLTAAAHAYGGCDLYVGDDGLVYC